MNNNYVAGFYYKGDFIIITEKSNINTLKELTKNFREKVIVFKKFEENLEKEFFNKCIDTKDSVLNRMFVEYFKSLSKEEINDFIKEKEKEYIFKNKDYQLFYYSSFTNHKNIDFFYKCSLDRITKINKEKFKTVFDVYLKPNLKVYNNLEDIIHYQDKVYKFYRETAILNEFNNNIEYFFNNGYTLQDYYDYNETDLESFSKKELLSFTKQKVISLKNIFSFIYDNYKPEIEKIVDNKQGYILIDNEKLKFKDIKILFRKLEEIDTQTHKLDIL